MLRFDKFGSPADSGGKQACLLNMLSIAPGTEGPEADGLTFRRVKAILRRLGTRGKMVGVDLVEVNPCLDHAELTQHIAVQLLIESLASGLG